MVETKALIRASLDAGRDFFRPPHGHPESTSSPAEPLRAAKPVPHLVPIRAVGPSERHRIAAHLMALAEHDRYLRFGYAAND